MTKGLYIKTFGCQMNEYDSSKMVALLERSHGLQLVATPEQARVLLLNTCSVREKAQEKLFSELGRWRPFKLADPRVIIAVGGCVASQEGERIWDRAPFVDVVFGPQTLHRLPALIAAAERGDRRVIDISFPEIENSTICPRRALTDRAPLSRLWKDAANTAASVLCPIRAVKNSVVRSTM